MSCIQLTRAEHWQYVFAVQEEVVVTWNPHRQDVDLPWTMGMMSTMLRSRLIHMDHRVEVLSIHLLAQAHIQALVNQYVLVIVVSCHMFDFSRFIINHMCFFVVEYCSSWSVSTILSVIQPQFACLKCRKTLTIRLSVSVLYAAYRIYCFLLCDWCFCLVKTLSFVGFSQS